MQKPGPWTIGVERDDGSKTITGLGAYIATLCTHAGWADESIEGNAHLISAAPELLGACKVVLEEIGAPEPWKDLSPEAWAIVRAAVNKAEGS